LKLEKKVESWWQFILSFEVFYLYEATPCYHTSMRTFISGLIITALLFFTASCTTSKEEIPPKPNILLIVADDLGFTDLGCYGSEIKTPHLDALAAEGIRNTAFYTAPTCSPTRSMLLTGIDNHRTGYGTMEGDLAPNQVGLAGYETHLNFDVVPFPELLQANGYHTGIAGKWHQAFPPSESLLWPDKRGFDRSFCLLQGGAGHFSDQQPLFAFTKKTLYVENGSIVDSLPSDFYSSDFYTQKAIGYINESKQQNKPFFTYLAFTAPHWPLQVPDEYLDLYEGKYDEGYEVLARKRLQRGKELGIITATATVPPLSPNVVPWNEPSVAEQHKSARTMEIYAAMIERLDANVGKLIAHLKATGEYENTLILFMADNGAEGNEIGNIKDSKKWIREIFDNSLNNMGRRNFYVYTGPSWAQVGTLPFKWYKGFSTEGGVQCPSIIRLPGGANQGSINPDYISVKDFAPTILEVAGVQHPGSTYKNRKVFPMDGTSLVNWLNGEEESAHKPDEVHCWELYGRRGVRQGNWKAEWQDGPYGNNTWELYNLQQDPGELRNLSTKNPEKLNKLITEWDKYARKYKVTLPSQHVG
jgi:arylsulfatase